MNDPIPGVTVSVSVVYQNKSITPKFLIHLSYH